MSLVAISILLAVGCGTKDEASDRNVEGQPTDPSAPRSLSCDALIVGGISDYLPGAKGAERPEDLMSRRESADATIEIVKSEREAVGYVTVRGETVEIVQMKLTDGQWLEMSSDRCGAPQ